ncbi:MAG: tetratricopeptide repeat protein, partial [Bacteroidota bacterium]
MQALLDWNHYIYQSDVELSINLMNQIISICQTNLNLPSETLSERQRRYYNMAMAMSFRHLGKLYRSKGHYSKALTFANESLKVFERIDNEALVTGSMSEIGVIHSLKGDFASAIQIFTKNLKRKEEIDDRAGVAYSLTDIGYIYARIEDYEKAREYFQESLVLREKYCAPVHVAGGYFNMGYVSTALGDFSKAMKYHNKALDLRREIGNKYYIAASLNAIGDIHKKQKDLSEALKHYKKSVELYEELGEDLSLASCLNNIGEVHRLRGEFLSAIRFNQKALDLTRGSEELDAIKESYYSLYLSYKKLGKPLMAFTMFEKFNVYSDSILRKEDQRAVIRQEFAYQYEKQSLADSLRIAEAQQLADAQYAAQRAESIQERQKVIFIAFSLLLLLCLSGFIFYKRRKELQEKLDCEHKEANRLKELDQFKSKLYTNLTHEFRTPLTVILGMSERLQKEPQKFIQEGTQIIERNGKNLLRIINQLLDLSKMENHSLQLQLQNSDMIAYLRYITESFSAYANGKNIALRFHSSEEHLLMDYDSEQIMQVMTNLLSNALKFTPSGGGVMIRVAKKQSDLEIRVSDNGIGIPKQALSQIFKRFYQVDDSITRGYEGTGIGLAHTKELIHLMEGQIEVESIYRQDVVDQVSGTTFIIRLPIKSSAPAMENHSVLAPNNANSTKEVPLPVPGASITNQNLPKLLVIEDNPDVVFYLRSCLENDYQLEVAYNGKVGLEKAFEVVPDLIVSDIMMPEKDGIEVCDILKNDERTSHIPVVLLTAKADLNSRLQGLRRGADAHLAKPFQKE